MITPFSIRKRPLHPLRQLYQRDVPAGAGVSLLHGFVPPAFEIIFLDLPEKMSRSQGVFHDFESYYYVFFES